MIRPTTHTVCESVSRLGLVVRCSAGKRKDAGSTPRFGSPFSSKIAIHGHCLVTLSCTMNETLNWLHVAAHLNAEIIPVVTVQWLDTSSLSTLPSYCLYHFCKASCGVGFKYKTSTGQACVSDAVCTPRVLIAAFPPQRLQSIFFRGM